MMSVRNRLLGILIAALVGGRHHNVADASRPKGENTGVSEKSADAQRDRRPSNWAVKNLDALDSARNGNQELHIEKNDFIDVSWQRRHPELFRVKRKTATIALDVKDNTYRVWTHDYPAAAVPLLPYGIGAVSQPVYHVPMYPTTEPVYSGYPAVLSGGAPVPLPIVAQADYATAPPYYHGWYSPSYSFPYAGLPWAAPYAGAGYFMPDIVAGYHDDAPLWPMGYNYYPDIYSSLPDLGWAGDYLQ